KRPNFDNAIDLEDSYARNQYDDISRHDAFLMLTRIEQELDKLRRGLDQHLPADRGEMLVAMFQCGIEGYSHSEISEKFSVPKSTVTRHLNFVCAWLRSQIL
ncbi:MAG: hypothetical protein KC431_09835, partial [Myxococcales bacterium]|nr:hypothetical protein [Myxococcales bacterium]